MEKGIQKRLSGPTIVNKAVYIASARFRGSRYHVPYSVLQVNLKI